MDAREGVQVSTTTDYKGWRISTWWIAPGMGWDGWAHHVVTKQLIVSERDAAIGFLIRTDVQRHLEGLIDQEGWE